MQWLHSRERPLPVPLLSRDQVIDRLFVVFRDHAYDGATLSLISQATGLGKSSLYHYFPGGKDDMVRAVFDRIETWLNKQVEIVDGTGPRASDSIGSSARSMRSIPAARIGVCWDSLRQADRRHRFTPAWR